MTTLDHQPRGASAGEEFFIVLLTRMGLVVTGLLTQSLLAYALLPEGRGAYAVCVLFATVAGLLLTPGADRGTQYFVMSGGMSVSSGLSAAALICAVGSAAAVLAALPLMSSGMAFFEKADPAAFRASLWLIPILAFSTACQQLLSGLRRFRRVAFATAWQAVLNVLGILVLVRWLDGGVTGAVVALSSSHVVMIALCVLDLRRRDELTVVLPGLAQVRDVVEFGMKYYVARVGNLVDLQIGVFFLAAVAPRAEIGLFAAASALMLKAFMIGDAIEASLLPRVAASDGGRPELVGLSGRIAALCTGMALLCVLAVSDPVVRVLLSERFLPVAHLFFLMAPGVFVYSGTKVIMVYFQGINRPGTCSWAVWIGMVVNLGMLWMLYPEHGVDAAAMGMSAGFFARSVFLVTAFRAASGMTLWTTWLPRTSDALYVAEVARTLLRRVTAARTG